MELDFFADRDFRQPHEVELVERSPDLQRQLRPEPVPERHRDALKVAHLHSRAGGFANSIRGTPR